MLGKARVLGRMRWLVIGPFLLVVALLAGLVVASADILSSARAYVGAESLWSKGQKDAVYHLGRYIASREAVDYLRFQNALPVPLGDRAARLALEQRPPQLDVARRGFLDAGNHPDDVEGMVQLFLRFRNVRFMADAIAIWTEADEQMQQLAQLGREIHLRIEAGDAAASPTLQTLVAQLPSLNERLTVLEQRFSATLGEASRTARHLVLVVTLLLASGLTAGGMFLTAYLLRQQARAELALRESNDRWALAAGAAGIGLFDWDLRTGCATLDARAAALYGLPPEALEVEAGLLSREAVHPDDVARLRAAMTQTIAHPAPVTIRYRLRLAGGAVRQLEAIATVRHHAEGAARGAGLHMVGILRDVSDEMRAAQLQLDKEAAERAYRAKGEFLSRVSHELRTPLNAVLGFTELMQTDPAEPLTHSQNQRVQRVLDAGRHLLALINDILDLGSIDESSAPLATQPVGLATVLQASLHQLEPMAQAQQIQLRAELPGAELCVQADARRLEQVFANLLSNAIKYNRSGGEVQLSCAREGDAVLVTVRDTGMGLSAEQIEQMFQPFNRLGAEFSKVPGSGLGLVITQQLVKRMGGS
ncbi:MAG TPA: PAS domain-containing sensor histidine kinase, partial [Rhizobacter sp.]|nr:PAS domain-containing sensor histidine kinase [Rhizobacter sp.]